MKLIDITFHANHEYADTTEMLEKQAVSLNHIPALKQILSVTVIKHISNKATRIDAKEGFYFFRSFNGFFHIPFRSIHFIASFQPDIVLVQGLLYPLQLMVLKWKLGKKVKIIAKHHAESPYLRFRKIFLQWADYFIDAYFFTSKGNASIWLEKGIIKDTHKIFEIPDTLSDFKRLSKNASRQALQIGEGPVFLWVGRLDKNKDPLLLLEAFESYFQKNQTDRLYLIYQTTDLLAEVKTHIAQSFALQNSVKLIGFVAYSDLPQWYSAADYFVSASYSEGGSTALLEAMSCGCIPIVTAIPAALKVTDNGRVGYHFMPGKINELQNILDSLADKKISSEEVLEHFEAEYSVQAVAEKIAAICKALVLK